MSKTMVCPPPVMCDFYKISHPDQYPDGTEFVYSTLIPRESRIEGITAVVAFGFQHFIKDYLIEEFNEWFFDRDVEEVCAEYERVIRHTLGNPNPDSSRLRALHELGYLPLEIRAVKEGTLVPLRVPMLTIENTHPEFFWLTNFLETVMSSEVWKMCTNATIAREYRKELNHWAEVTGGDRDFVQFQGHDFSFRGMSGRYDAMESGAAHLLSFHGTDTIPAILFLEKWYGANIEEELVGTSIPATEHTVMCSHGQDEYETIRWLITEKYPSGPISIVCDTWNFFNVICNIIPRLKDEILARDGIVVVRPDSGDPADIICGTGGKVYPNTTLGRGGVGGQALTAANPVTPEEKGAFQILWEIFGGSTNEKGYRTLDPHIGLIYGDSITLPRCKDICRRLAANGFVPTMVLGIGSYTYQYNTRDTFGFKLGATWVQIDGEGRNVFKDPATDKNHMKKSLTGQVVVEHDDMRGGYYVIDGLSKEERETYNSYLEPVFRNGRLLRDEKYADISQRVLESL